jgi:hypothetical protein
MTTKLPNPIACYHSENPTNQNPEKIRTSCAGKGCHEDGTNLLYIIYLHRSGWFCDSCAKLLKKEGLITEDE